MFRKLFLPLWCCTVLWLGCSHHGGQALNTLESKAPAGNTTGEKSNDDGRDGATISGRSQLMFSQTVREILVGRLASADPDTPSLDTAWTAIAAQLQASAHRADCKRLTIDYPLDGSIFPPEIVPPTLLWHDETPGADAWLVAFVLNDGESWLGALVPGDSPPEGEIDPRCLTETNEVYRGTPYQRTAKAWTVHRQLWEKVKQRSVEAPYRLLIIGFSSDAPTRALSSGAVLCVTSRDPVGAPIFYRDVPLAPSQTERGVIKPLSEAFLPLIAWRLRDISQPESRLVLTGLLTCANCHSFSKDGKTLGMDVDGPAGDKGAYAIVPIEKETIIEQKDIITWNSFEGKPPGQKTIGFLSQVSPDGRYVITTLNESVYVQNFTDYRFLQVFYPTRGILGYYDRETKEMKPLPGADDPRYVHCDPVWTPDGQTIIFARAEAKDPYPPGYRPAVKANDPNEPQIQYSLYRIPFRNGQGGVPEPIPGASHNGMSNTFPKVSPDGKWIVFVKCRNGQLLRPDSELWIVPTSGGEARRMRCNTSLMNSWHSFSPNGRWMVFSSKVNTPYTQMFLTHIDENGNDSPPILIPNSTAANRAVNLPEFVNRPYEEFVAIRVPATEYLEIGMRGIKLYEQGRLDEALQQFELALQKQPDYLEAHVSIAVILMDQGRWEEAIPKLEKALQLDPDCWFAHANLGIIREKQGRKKEALAHFQKAVELMPTNLNARLNLGRALAEAGAFQEAITQFEAAIRLAPILASSSRYCYRRCKRPGRRPDAHSAPTI
ncbi:tetratricopeptide repeat protein [Thermogutta sp.]|uniref:tetratricopeptide repeat protein n=1 Tax=Thermogutta sp. TaxID=1962930 RepID=UPI003C7CEF68